MSSDKLSGFPTVRYVTLKQRVDRQQFMKEQFDKYRINYVPYFTDKISDMDPQPVITGKYVHTLGQTVGVVISHLRCLKNWYDTTSEDMILFCEDDNDFSSIEHWNFTWQEFLQNLPKNWECIQLIRLISPLWEGHEQEFKLDLRHGRWWGCVSLMTRSWVKKILDRHVISDNEYRLDIDEIQPIVENVLYLGLGDVYNFPLITENNSFLGTIKECADEDYIKAKIPHIVSEKKIKECWKNIDTNIKIEQMLRL